MSGCRQFQDIRFQSNVLRNFVNFHKIPGHANSHNQLQERLRIYSSQDKTSFFLALLDGDLVERIILLKYKKRLEAGLETRALERRF